MSLPCTMPKCRGRIKGMTGLQMIQGVTGHFFMKHGLTLSLEMANQFLDAIETGMAPIRIDKPEREESVE